MNSRKITIIVVLSILIIAYFLVQIKKASSEHELAVEKTLPSVDSLSSEYARLISPKYKKLLTVHEVRRSKVRNPIAFTLFDQQYHLIMYKIDLLHDEVIGKILTTSHESVDRTTGVTYRVVANGFFRFQHKVEKVSPVSKIMITLAGDSLKTTAANDSIISYHLNCDNFSIRYSEEEPIDIFLTGKEKALGRTIAIPLDVLFIKRNKALFLLLMIPKDPKASIAPDLLHNTVLGL